MANNTNKALKGISSQATVTLLLGILEIVSFSIMSRLLSKDDFGFYAAINAIVIVFASLSETGIGSAIVQKKDPNSRYINNAFTLSMLFGIVSMSTLLLATYILPNTFINEKMRLPLMLMSVTLLLNCVSSIFRSILHKQLKFFTIGLVQLLSLIITTIVAVILAIMGFGYYAIIAKAILGSLLSFVLFFFLSKTRYGFRIDKETFKSIFQFSGWLMASRFFSELAKQIDKLLMPNLVSISTLGAYSRPKDFVSSLSVRINGIFDSALFPVLSSLQDNLMALKSAYTKSLYTLNMFAFCMAILFAVNSRIIMRIFFGVEWLYLAPVLAIFSVWFVFSANGRIADCYLRSLGRTKLQFIFRIIEFLTKIIGVVVGSRWGLIGITLGVVIMESIIKFIKVTCAGRIIEMPISEIIVTLLQSCRYVLFVMPVLLLFYFVLPQNIYGEIVLLVLSLLVLLLIFLLCPKLIGNKYNTELYPMIIKYVSNLREKVRNK